MRAYHYSYTVGVPEKWSVKDTDEQIEKTLAMKSRKLIRALQLKKLVDFNNPRTIDELIDDLESAVAECKAFEIEDDADGLRYHIMFDPEKPVLFIKKYDKGTAHISVRLYIPENIASDEMNDTMKFLLKNLPVC